MDKNECVSVIVPVYGVEAYLEKCLDSLLAQSYQNLEIILVDDGGRDGCPAICDAYAQRDSRVRVIHKQNGGLSSARNVGIGAATGAWLAFVDSDDYVAPQMMETLHAAAVRNGAQLCICGHYTQREGRLMIEEPPLDEERCHTPQQALRLLMQDVHIKNYAWDKLYAAHLFKGVRYPEGRNYEDIATTYRLFDNAQVICQVPGYYYYYQIRESGISFTQSDEKWMANCRDIVTSMRERWEYFVQKGDAQLGDEALAQLVPYIITLLNLQYRLARPEEGLRAFLAQHLAEIAANPALEQKHKKLAAFYTGPRWLCKGYAKLEGVRHSRVVRRVAGAASRRLQKLPPEYSFALAEGKTTRLIHMELPCFDNLGDHAITYAMRAFARDFVAEHPGFQFYSVQGWHTLPALKALRPLVQKNDIFMCHAGGNMGNLYPFAEAFRHKLAKAFPQNPIVVFPQSVHFTADVEGQRSLARSQAVYSRCQRLTLLARDEQSCQLMRRYYTADVHLMKDIVAYLDKSPQPGTPRQALLLCLRSDVESALGAGDKMELEAVCRRHSGQVLITDTVSRQQGDDCNREILEKKWDLFGRARLVVTDRLHGMVFALITQTPCVVIGNNHHKVEKTYESFKACPYLYFAQSPQAVEALVQKALAAPLPSEKTAWPQVFGQMKELILEQAQAKL